jgi:hypothetical protein
LASGFSPDGCLFQATGRNYMDILESVKGLVFFTTSERQTKEVAGARASHLFGSAIFFIHYCQL